MAPLAATAGVRMAATAAEAPSRLDARSKQIGRALRHFGAARKMRGLDADDLLIVLALGHLGLRLTAGRLREIAPVSCADVSRLLDIPKETVRRKAARLAAAELVEVNGRGVRLRDIALFLQLSDVLGQDCQENVAIWQHQNRIE